MSEEATPKAKRLIIYASEPKGSPYAMQLRPPTMHLPSQQVTNFGTGIAASSGGVELFSSPHEINSEEESDDSSVDVVMNELQDVPPDTRRMIEGLENLIDDLNSDEESDDSSEEESDDSSVDAAVIQLQNAPPETHRMIAGLKDLIDNMNILEKERNDSSKEERGDSSKEERGDSLVDVAMNKLQDAATPDTQSCCSCIMPF